MQKEEKGKRIKSILSIETNIKQEHNSMQSPKQLQDIIQVKTLRSTKNQFQLKEMFFRSKKHQEGIARKYSFTLSQLQKEKEQLIQSIHILKIGAISAIAQKIDNFQRLEEVASCQNFQEIAIYEEILKNSQFKEKELQDRLKHLYDQIQKERESLTDILQQKEARIQQLQHLVCSLKSQIEELQSNQRKIIQQMKQLQNRIYYLSKQIQEYKISETLLEQIEKNINYECLRQKFSSVASSIQCSKSTNNLLNDLPTKDFPTSIEKEFAQKIQYIKQRQIQEVQDIKEFYETKIANIRNTYNVYFSEQILIKEQKSKIKDKKQLSLVEENKGNKILNRHYSSDNTSHFTNQIIQNLEKMSEPQVHILKQEINFVHQSYTPCNQNIYKDSNQLKRDYSENSFAYAKQKSTPSIQHLQNNKQVTKSVEVDKFQASQHSFKDKIENKKEIKWQKTNMFAIGLVSGVTLISVIKLIIKKKNIKGLLKYFMI